MNSTEDTARVMRTESGLFDGRDVPRTYWIFPRPLEGEEPMPQPSSPRYRIVYDGEYVNIVPD